MEDISIISNKLISAVCAGNLESVRQLIRRYGLSYSQEWSDGYVLLRYAVKHKHTDITKLLLANDAKVNIEENQPSSTPLHFAVGNGDKEIVELLLDRGANIDARGKHCLTSNPPIREGYTPLHLAVEKQDEKMVKLLLNKGANVNAKGKGDKSSLHIAVERGSLQIVKNLLKNGANVNFVNTSYHRYTPLHLAVEKGSEEVIKLLLSSGANADAKAENNQTALHIATKRGRKEVVEILLKYDAKVNSKFKNHITPLHIASRTSVEIVEILLKFDADINSKDEYGKTAFHIASASGFVEIVEILLKFGADIHSKDKFGRTALHCAAVKNHVKMIECLLKFGVDIDSKDIHGRTALHNASDCWNVNVVITLLNNCSDINVECNNNCTPLELSIARLSLSRDNFTYQNVYSDNDSDYSDVLSLNNYEKVNMNIKCHIIKMISANSYISEKNLHSITSDDKLCFTNFQNKCEKEISSIKSENVNNANVSFYDILKEKDLNKLIIYARNENILQVLKSDDYKIRFPIYASMINSNFRKGEKRRELLEQNKIFHFFYNNFRLPTECTEKICSYLNNIDLRTLNTAF